MVVEFIPSLIWLLVVSFSFGFALTREKGLTTFGFGLALFALLSVLFNLVGIPLNWLVYLAIALILLGYFIYRKELELTVTKPDMSLTIVLIMAVMNVAIFWSGATSYPWLEDDDPWVHAVGTKWVSETESYSRYFNPETFYRLYIEPYPPVYDVLMGVLHQMTESVSDTLKFYNVLLIGLALIFAFYAIEELTKNRKLALLAAFFLFALPSFMGHFIWAQTLAMLFLFITFYGYEKALKDKRYIIPAGISTGAIAITQPSVAVTFVFLAALYVLAKYYVKGKEVVLPLILCGAIGILIAASYYIPTYLKFGPEYTAHGMGFMLEHFDPTSGADTSEGLVYGIADYLIVQPQGKIDQHVGIGIAIALLVLAGLFSILKNLKSSERKAWLLYAILWLIFAFLGTEGNALPIKLFPHRFWVFLSIPVAMIAAHGYLVLEERFERHKKLLLVLMVLAVFVTSFAGKMTVQTSSWPPGVRFTSQGELSGYVTMAQSLPKNTLIFPLCSEDSKIIGFDMLSEPFVPEYELFKHDVLQKSPEEVYSFISSRGYSYLTIDPNCVSELGLEEANLLVSSYLSSGSYEQAYSNQMFILLKVK